jgi:hypothetical protein
VYERDPLEREPRASSATDTSVKALGIGHNGGPVLKDALITGDAQSATPIDQRSQLQRALYSVRQTEELLSISHAQCYRLINAGLLDARKIGAKTVITAPSIERYIEGLPKFSQKAA